MEDEEILCNSLDLIYDLVNSKQDFKENKLSQIIFKICDFMNNKNNQRYPCLQCMKLLDIFLTNEKDENKNNDNIKYIDCVINVMIFKVIIDDKDTKSIDIENEINILGNNILGRLLDDNYFNTLLNEFCENVENYEPNKNVKTVNETLETNIKRMTGIIEVKNYYEIGAETILISLKKLIEKEIQYIEFFKREKSKEKNPEFNTIIEKASLSILFELNLNLKISKISKQKLNFEILMKSLDIIFLLLTKSTDKKSIKYLLDYLKQNYEFIIDNSENIKLPENNNVIEKIIGINISLLRKMIEEDDIVLAILLNLIYLSEKNVLYCNYMVKSGCPRLLLQIIDTSLNEKNVEFALELLKIISNSNEDNIKIISSQNALNIFFQAKNKYEGNNLIINICDDISKVILKLPGQENYVMELISENINQFNINAKKDFSDKEIRQQLLHSLQIINSFVSSQTQTNLINSNEEFLNNFKEIFEKTFQENEIDSINEKLLNNGLSLLNKINSESHKYFGYIYIIDKSIDIIKNKNKYLDILITATNELLKYLPNQTLYENIISKKMDVSFIDCIFDAVDNYLDNIQATKNLKNILFYLYLYNSDFAEYIKKKGGLSNVYEELKDIINSNDKSSNKLKLNSLQLIYSLCNNDNNEIESFIKSGGSDLLNKIIEIEMEKYKDYINNFESELYKVREIPVILQEKYSENNDENNDKDNMIIFYAFKLFLKLIDYDEKYINQTIINDLIILSEVNYPKKDIFNELSQLFLKDIKYLPSDEKYLFLLLKNILSLKIKFCNDKYFISNIIDKLISLILPKVVELNNYFTNFSLSLENNSSNPLQLYYLSEINHYYEELQLEKQIPIFENIEKYVIGYIQFYKEKEINNIQDEISTNITIPLLNLVIFILKNKKEDIKSIAENMSIFLFMSQQILFKNEYVSFSYEFILKCNSTFDMMEQNEDKTQCYLKYLSNIVSKTIDMLTYIHQTLSKENKYNSLDEITSSLFLFIIQYLKDYYTIEKNDVNIQINYSILLDIICELINVFMHLEEIDSDKRKTIIDDLYIIIFGILSELGKQNENLFSYQNIIFKLLNYIKEEKEKNNYFPKIINVILKNIFISQELYEKIIEPILNDLKSDPPFELEINLDSILILTKEIIIINNLIENSEFNSIILSLYKNQKSLSSAERKKIIEIYTNIFKNTYNTEIILNKNPEIIQNIISEEVQKNDGLEKEEEKKEYKNDELVLISSILKDKKNLEQLLEKKIVTKEGIDKIISNYEDPDNTTNEPLNELKNIAKIFKEEVIQDNEIKEEKVEIKEKEENNEDLNKEIVYFKSEKEQLTQLEEKIDVAYEEHLKIINKPHNREKDIVIDDNNDMNDLAIISKKRNLSIISNILIYNYEKNNKISSLISTKLNDEISTALKNLISLIHLVYSKNRETSNDEINKERINIIKQAFVSLKKYTICPYNHKIIIELGLLSFIEKLNKKEEFRIYLIVLDVLKNCSYSENVIQILISSSYYDHFIKEMLNFYENPQIIKDNEENKKCFEYDNIILKNIIKFGPGFDSLFDNIGLEKVLLIGKESDNINMLNSIITNLNNKLENSKQNLNLSQLINDFFEICKKVFDMNIEEDLFVQTLKLIVNVFKKTNEDFSNHFDIIKIINSTFDKYKNNYDYLANILFLSKVVCLKDKTFYNEIIEFNLINKILEQIKCIEYKDDLIYNYSDLLYNILEIVENKENLLTTDIINHALYFINEYSQKLDVNNKSEGIKEKNEKQNTNLDDKNSVSPVENTVKIYNSILNNYLKLINYSLSKEIKIDIINENYIDTISNTINKKQLDVMNINICLFCLNYYFIKTPKENWKNENIQNIYLTLNHLKETYFTNSDILKNVAQLVGIILQGLSLKFLIERFYSLALDSISCQDWNEELVIFILTILKECLIKYEELLNIVFDSTEQVILNLLKLYPNQYSIVLNCYDTLALFCKNNEYAQILINYDLISFIRSSLINKEFNMKIEQKNEMRLVIYKLIHILIYDKDINAKISIELMGYFISDLKEEIFCEYLEEIAKILLILFKNKLTIETFMQNSGLDTLLFCLDKFYEKKKFTFDIFIIIRDIIFSSNENKEKVKNSNLKEKIQNVMEKLEENDKKLKMEGKILLYNINYTKKEKIEENKDKTKKLTYIDYIEKEKIIKNKLYDIITKGIPMKSINPKGKIKDFDFCFSPDLMRIYLKKPKCGTLPPKPKYTIETPLVKDVIKDYSIPNFKKGKPPDKQICFAIEQELVQEQKSPKILVMICNNDIEAKALWGCTEIIVDYIKRKCGKEYNFRIDDYKTFFDEIQFNKLPNKNFDRRRSSVMIRSSIK